MNVSCFLTWVFTAWAWPVHLSLPVPFCVQDSPHSPLVPFRLPTTFPMSPPCIWLLSGVLMVGLLALFGITPQNPNVFDRDPPIAIGCDWGISFGMIGHHSTSVCDQLAQYHMWRIFCTDWKIVGGRGAFHFQLWDLRHAFLGIHVRIYVYVVWIPRLIFSLSLCC